MPDLNRREQLRELLSLGYDVYDAERILQAIANPITALIDPIDVFAASIHWYKITPEAKARVLNPTDRE
jgi:hypothetical protein